MRNIHDRMILFLDFVALAFLARFCWARDIKKKLLRMIMTDSFMMMTVDFFMRAILREIRR
jgi:hypothetical protein